MKNTFWEYHSVDDNLLIQMWNEATFVFDTNVLLNLYRYSEKTSDEFMQIISGLDHRVWLPFQVGFEFNKNRLTVLSDQRRDYNDFEKKIFELINKVENKNRDPFFSQQLTDKFIEIKAELNAEVKVKNEAYDSSLKNDKILEKVNDAFENKVGIIFSPDEISKHQKEGEKRYKNKVPPGYCDIKKSENERYGDLFLWKEIIIKSKQSKTNVIFILDDRKEDWWLEHQGKTVSPRPELLKEFHLETGMKIHFYKPFQFLKYSNQYLHKHIDEDIIEEVKNYSPTTTKSNSYIQLELKLKGDMSSFNLLASEMKNTGYNIITESNNDDIHYLNVSLPNIPDLERRFKSKFLSQLSELNMHIIESNKEM